MSGVDIFIFSTRRVCMTPRLHCAPHIGTTTRRRHSGSAVLAIIALFACAFLGYSINNNQ